MPIMDMLKDPATGNFKPAVLIGGAGIGIAGVFLLMSRGAGNASGVASSGQSGANTDALSALSDAILGLAGNIGGGGGSGGTITSPPGGTSTNPGGLPTYVPGVSGAGMFYDPTTGGRVIGIGPMPASLPTTTVSSGFTSEPVGVVGVVKQGSITASGQTYPTGMIPLATAVSKPSNSGLSGAPTTVVGTR